MGFPGGSTVKIKKNKKNWKKKKKTLPAVQETCQSLGWEDPPEKGMTIHSNILAWEIPWTWSLASYIHGVTKSWTQLNDNTHTYTHTHTHIHTPYFTARKIALDHASHTTKECRHWLGTGEIKGSAADLNCSVCGPANWVTWSSRIYDSGDVFGGKSCTKEFVSDPSGTISE